MTAKIPAEAPFAPQTPFYFAWSRKRKSNESSRAAQEYGWIQGVSSVISSSRLFLHGNSRFAGIDDDLLVYLLFRLAPLDPFPGSYPAIVQVEVENPDLAVETAISSVAPETRAARVAHPKVRLLGICVSRQCAIFIGVITVPNVSLTSLDAIMNTTYCPQLIMLTPCSTRASRKPEL